MEYCSRGDLTTVLKQEASLPESFIWYVLSSVLQVGLIVCNHEQTLQFLHSLHVVHCDIKPDNLLFTELGMLRVGDLGCATRCNDLGDVSDLRYMSLEGLNDEFSPCRDIFRSAWRLALTRVVWVWWCIRRCRERSCRCLESGGWSCGTGA